MRGGIARVQNLMRRCFGCACQMLRCDYGDLSGQVVVHSSGALDRGAVAPAKRAGARTGQCIP
jgi:predicted short-subunit dehydrogenase-like oxidoreductase (DUF2520 family)